MIDLVIKNVFQNSNKIDTIINHINKTNKRYCAMFLLIAANFYITTKIIKNHDNKIKEFESKLEEIKSKGE